MSITFPQLKNRNYSQLRTLGGEGGGAPRIFWKTNVLCYQTVKMRDVILPNDKIPPKYLATTDYSPCLFIYFLCIEFILDGFSISLNFTEFDTENYDGCSFDYVLVKEKNSTIGRYCGKDKKHYSNVPKHPIQLTSNFANVEFITDHSNEEVFHGFEAHYAAQG